MALQAIIVGAAAGLAALIVQRRLGWAVGLASGLAVAVSPTLLFLASAVMLDNALALMVLIAAVCWAEFARRPTLWRAALFALCGAMAILTKGNAFGLALVPLLHAAFMRDAAPLRRWQAWAAAAAVGVVTLSWHAATFGMQASGFNYAFGWDYTGRAIPFYALASLADFGPVACVGLVAGLLRAARQPRPRDPLLSAAAAAFLAMAAMALIAPADLSRRYLVPAVPVGVVVAAYGLDALARWAAARVRASAAASGAIAAGLLLAGAAATARAPHVQPFGMNDAAALILRAGPGSPMVVAAGSPRAEGALIAAFAVAEAGRSHYVLRATQLLAAGSFMGDEYATRFATAAAVQDWLDHSGAGWIVVDDSAQAQSLAHNRQLLDALSAQSPEWTLVSANASAEGSLRVYRHVGPAPSPEQSRALLARVVPNG